MPELCTNCRRAIPEGDLRFCPYCGLPFLAPLAEQRYAVVVFADLAGFTELSTSIPPASLRKLLDDLMQRFCRIVSDYGAKVDKIIGDCVMFVFGTERTSTRDATRALETIDAMKKELEAFNRENRLTLSLHASIANGIVSVGRVGPSQTVMGEVVNLASRLLHVGAKDDVIVSPTFADLLDETVRLEALTPTELKGFTDPVVPFRYLGFRRDVTPHDLFFGRGPELENLDRLLDTSREKRTPQWILLQGSAGIGKSGLLRSFLGRLWGRDLATVLVSFEDSSSRPMEGLQALFGKLLNRSELDSDERRSTWKQFELALSISTSLDSEQYSTLVSQMIDGVVRKRPLVLALEDLHAAPPAIKTIFNRIREMASTGPLLVCATSRMAEEGFDSTVALSPLPENAAKELFAHLIHGRTVSNDVSKNALAGCAGNPFLIRTVARAIQRSVHPSNLFGGNTELLLSSTLDTFPKATQETIKTASLFGRHVPMFYLSKMTGEPEAHLRKSLAPVGVFHVSDRGETFVFEHVLLQEAAYRRIDTTLLSDLHGKAGAILEEVKAPAEQVAYHYVRSDQKLKAVAFAVQAARRLSRTPASEQALEFARKAEELARELDDPAVLAEGLSLRFQIESRNLPTARAVSLWDRFAKTVPADHQHSVLPTFLYAKAELLCDHRSDDDCWKALGEIEALDPKVDTSFLKARLFQHRERLKECRQLVTEQLSASDLPARKRGEFLRLLCDVEGLEYHFEEAKQAGLQAHAVCRSIDDFQGVLKSNVMLGWLAYRSNRYEEAKDHYTEASELSLKLGDLLVHCRVLLSLALVNFRLLDFRECFRATSQGLDLLSGGLNHPLLNRFRLTVADTAYLTLGEYQIAESYFQLAHTYFSEHGPPEYLTEVLAGLAHLRLKQGRFEEGIPFANESLNCCPKGGDAELVCRLLRADLLSHLGADAEAKAEWKTVLKYPHANRLPLELRTYFRIVASTVTGRKDRKQIEEILRHLADPEIRPISFDRLDLLREVLLYGPDPRIQKQYEVLRDQLREKVPEKYRARIV
ncbi:MAG: adenylate/guanylate cyclase domain-containing protein [Pseudomonadota bacterium]